MWYRCERWDFMIHELHATRKNCSLCPWARIYSHLKSSFHRFVSGWLGRNGGCKWKILGSMKRIQGAKIFLNGDEDQKGSPFKGRLRWTILNTRVHIRMKGSLHLFRLKDRSVTRRRVTRRRASVQMKSDGNQMWQEFLRRMDRFSVKFSSSKPITK
jgi:hypothetical protein